MGVSLEELLESSGINSLNSESVEKTASDNAHEDVDLVAELRKMADSHPAAADDENTKTLAAQELAEKTAEIAVIAQTLTEIEKVASLGFRDKKIAAFIKVAMDSGHSEREIATFLKEAAVAEIGQRIARGAKSVVQSARRPFIRAADRKYMRGMDAERRLLREKLVSGSPEEIKRHIKTLKSQYGQGKLVEELDIIRRDLGRLPYEAMRELPKSMQKPGFVLTLPGGTQKLVSTEAAKAYGIPAAAAAGGIALGAKGKGDGGGKVTVVKS